MLDQSLFGVTEKLGTVGYVEFAGGLSDVVIHSPNTPDKVDDTPRALYSYV